VSDYFVICHADSATQVKAIANSIEDEIYKAIQQDPWRKEGLEYGEWILLDYVNVVIHVFRTDKREFYGVEELWGDAEVKSYKSA
jgi:ribosome-associated protein